MATVNVDLYALWEQDKFVSELSDGYYSPAPPSLPSIVAGDTWNINAYFLDDDPSNFYKAHRFAGASVSARIRAAGNNHVYADATASAENPAATAPVIDRTQSGSGSQVEIQTVAFSPAVEFYQSGGNGFKIVFSGAGSGGRGGGTSLEGITELISPRASAAFIRFAIHGIRGFYQGNDGPYTWDELSSRYGSAIRPVTVSATYRSVNGKLDTITIQFGDVYGGANWWNTSVHLATVDDSLLRYKTAWAISLPFTASDFTDYLIPANGPAYIEVLLNGNVAGSLQLSAASTGNAPAFTNGPPPASGAVGALYNFAYAATGFPVPTFSLTSGALPPGITLNSVGQLSGTPSAAGTFTGIVTATNAAGSATQAFSIIINQVGGGGGGGGGGGAITPLAGVYYDGDHTSAFAVGIARQENPFHEAPGCRIYRQRYRIIKNNFAELALDTPFSEDTNAGLVEETERQDAGFGLVEWDRVWATVPPTLVDFQAFNYPYQQLYQYPNGAWAIWSIILVRTATVTRTFIRTGNAGNIALARLPRVIMFNNTPQMFDGFSNLNFGATTIAADDTLERWMGNIWVKTHWTIRI